MASKKKPNKAKRPRQGFEQLDRFDSLPWNSSFSENDDPFSISVGSSELEGGFLSLEEIDESEYGLEIPKPERENKKERTKENKNEKKRKPSEVEDELGGEVEAVSEEKDNKVKRKKKKKKKKKKNKDAKNSEENEEPTVEVSDPKDDIEGDLVDEAEYYAWNELRLLPLLMKAIYRLGFKEPTPIQKACIPAAAHQGKDVIGAAETGSGKTLAFGLPIFQRLLEEREKADNMFAEKGEAAEKIAPSRLLRALIITPTRELALQVTNHLKEVAKGTNFRVVPIVGGMSTEKQERLLKARPEIVVGTPGRLWELMSGGELHLIELHSLSFFVLDEADRMIENGHFHELQSIIDLLPMTGGSHEGHPQNTQNCVTVSSFQRKKRQTFVFSATLSLSADFRKKLKHGSLKSKQSMNDGLNSIETLSERAGMRANAAIVDLTNASIVADKLEESFIECREEDKDAYLYYILSVHGQGRTIIFCTSVAALRHASSLLRVLGINVWTLHAQMQQRARLKAIDRFRGNEHCILVATDVAARGLDIPGVRTVVHYQLPHSAEVYVHRSGRTARASADGCSIVWFRRDLRVEDSPALAAGVRAGAVVAVFIWAPEEEGYYYPGRVSRWWLKHSLALFDSSLRNLGTSLITKRSTDTVSTLLEIVKSTGATQLFFNHLYDPLSLVRDQRAKEVLTAQGIAVRSFNADLLYKPWEVHDDQGHPFTIFEAFWERCLSMPYDPEAPLLPPKRITSGDVSRCPSDTLIFEDELEKGSNALLARTWSPGWSNADKALTTFINGPLTEYSKNRRKADSATTSFLSPHLHFGEVSVRKVFHLVRIKQVLWANEGNKAGEESVNLFLKSIGLREYSRYMSFNHPYSHERPLLGHLKFFPWVMDEGYFKAWRQGRTGYPLVDAGMRELWATGWLHDRIRVVVSSFFVKVLQLPWRWGMKYFWDTLLDADLESDALGWQYISGTLPDSREFDCIDNPQFEGYKFDPNGEYVRRWLPELARLPTEWIHHPWNAPESVLQAAGIELGSNYPSPIVEIDAAKARLQEALSEMWQQEADSRAAFENGTDEGLGDSESMLIAFPTDIQMDLDHEPERNNNPTTVRRYEDQMVPSMTSSLLRVEEEETSLDLRNPVADSRAEVPRNVNVNQEPRREAINQGNVQMVQRNATMTQFNVLTGLQNAEDSTAESSGSSIRRERDGDVVPVWSPSTSSYSEQFVGEENGIGTSSSYLQRHPHSHQLLNWRQLSQTG